MVGERVLFVWQRCRDALTGSFRKAARSGSTSARTTALAWRQAPHHCRATLWAKTCTCKHSAAPHGTLVNKEQAGTLAEQET